MKVRQAGGKALLSITDQALNAGANAATGIVAYLLISDRATVGRLLLALTVGYVAIGLTRALVGDVLLIYAARHEGVELRRSVQDSTAVALAAGLLAAVICVGVWAVGGDAYAEVIWLAPALPLVFLHDAGRYAGLAAGQPQRALVLDVVWVITQVLGITVVLSAGVKDPSALVACWGLGGAAGALTFLLRDRVNPFFGRIRGWVSETRHLSGWFTATAVVGQLQVQVVALIVVHLLGDAAFAGLRLAQYVLLMPAMNVSLALIAVLAPRMSRLAHRGDDVGLRRLVRIAGVLFGSLLIVFVTAALLAEWVLDGIPRYSDVALLALPVALQAWIYLVQVPLTSAVRGMHQARLSFLQYAAFSSVSLTGVTAGAIVAGLSGAAWGLTTGASVGLAIMFGCYRYALHRLTQGAKVDHSTPPGEFGSQPSPNPGRDLQRSSRHVTSKGGKA